MAFKVITLAKTKELLGITGTDQDAQINRYIPIIDSKVKLITHNRYNKQIIGDTKAGSKIVEVYGLRNATGGIQNKLSLDTLVEYLEIGSLLSGTEIADGSYIDDVYYNGDYATISSVDYDVPIIELSEEATATNDDAQIFIGFNIGLQTTIAKGIAWLISQESTNIPTAGLTSRSIGPTSKSWNDSDSKIDGRIGMPAWFCKAFPVYMSGH